MRSARKTEGRIAKSVTALRITEKPGDVFSMSLAEAERVLPHLRAFLSGVEGIDARPCVPGSPVVILWLPTASHALALAFLSGWVAAKKVAS